MIRKLLYKMEYKRINKEIDFLDGYFENDFESRAALGEDYSDKKEYEKNTKRLDKLFKRSQKLEKILNL